LKIYNLRSTFSWFPPVLGGALIALTSSLTLRISYLWAFLILVGAIVAVMSLLARDFKIFWLSVYAFVLPLEIKKMLIGSGYIEDFVIRYGFPVGEIPGPVLYLSDLPLMVLLGVWAYEIAIKREKIYFPSSNRMALLLILWSGFSVINAPNYSLVFFEMFRFFKLYVLYLYIANNINSLKTVRAMVGMLFIGMVFQGILCLAQFFMRDVGILLSGLLGNQDSLAQKLGRNLDPFFNISEGGGSWKRASGTAGAANAEALYFEFLLPLAFLAWLTVTKKSSRYFSLAVFAFGLVGVLVTFSRGGFIGVAIGIIIAVVLAKSCSLITRRTFLTFSIAGSAAIFLAIPFAYEYLMTRPEATAVRWYLDKVGLAMIQDHPIFGVGLNNHMLVKPDYDPRFYVFQMPTHNHFLLMASQTGIPSLLFFLGFLFVTFKLAWKAAKKSAPYIACLAIGIIAAIFSVLVHVQVDYLGTYTTVSLLWLYSGLAAAISHWDFF